MKIKINRSAVIITLILIGIGLTFLSFWMFSNTKLFNDTVENRSYGPDVSFGWIHCAVNMLLVILDIVWLIFFIWECTEEDNKDRPFKWIYGDNYGKKENRRSYREDDEEPKATKPINWKRLSWYVIIIFLTLALCNFGKTIFRQSVFMYNTSKIYRNTYQQKVEEKQGFYDKLWKTYLQKEKITNINKDVFIQVTKLIMDNRADGEQLTWKWLQENQPIDYEIFSRFYADLSVFIAGQREGYFNIEKACQLIANKNNTLLDTFPNNIYNRALKIERINFEYGFLSDSTNNVFKSKVENLK